MKKYFILIILIIFIFLISFNLIAKDVYNCNRICGFCKDNSCCREWSGYIESTDNPDIYIWKSEIDNDKNSYLFYRINNNSNEFITKFNDVEDQELTISKDKNSASFTDGPDNIVECFLIK